MTMEHSVSKRRYDLWRWNTVFLNVGTTYDDGTVFLNVGATYDDGTQYS